MKSRFLDFFDEDNNSPHGFLHDIVCLLEKYDLMAYVLFWKNSSLFPSYRKWKSVVNSRLLRMHDLQLQAVSLEVPNVKLVFSAFTSMNPSFYWSLTSEMPDLVPKCRTQLWVMVNAGQGGVPWLRNSCKSICPICKSDEEDNYHFLLHCKAMSPEFDLFWSKLFSLIQTKATFEANIIVNFLRNLNDHSKVLLLTGGLRLPFQCSISVSIARFFMVSVHKLVKIRERLIARGIITPDRSSFSFHAVARWSMNDAFSLHHVLT